MPKHSQTSAQNVTYDKTEKNNKSNDKNQNNCSKKSQIKKKFFNVIMNIDSFVCFDVIFLEKKHAIRLPTPQKRYLLRHSDLKIAHKN